MHFYSYLLTALIQSIYSVAEKVQSMSKIHYIENGWDTGEDILKNSKN